MARFGTLFTYLFMAVSALLWGALVVLTLSQIIYLGLYGSELLTGASYLFSAALAAYFVMPGLMAAVSLWLPLKLRKENKPGRALVVPIASAVIWLLFIGITIIVVHVAIGV